MKPKHGIISHVRRHRLLADGMTQQALADRAGVTRQTISAVEKGNYAPSVGLALRLAAIFGTTVERLFTLDGGNEDA